jgi:hypothetical protein
MLDADVKSPKQLAVVLCTRGITTRLEEASHVPSKSHEDTTEGDVRVMYLGSDAGDLREFAPS